MIHKANGATQPQELLYLGIPSEPATCIEKHITIVYHEIYTMVLEKNIIAFEWDEGNTTKNWVKHQVSNGEAEEVFYDKNKMTTDDFLHSQLEKRFVLLGKTKTGRLLKLIYTVRQNKIRIISARDANRKEEKFYEETTYSTRV